MARKLNNESGVSGAAAHSSALSISDWDEGAPHSGGWFRIEITYRHNDFSFDRPGARASLDRVFLDPSDPSANHK
jgi:hypothetical protein